MSPSWQRSLVQEYESTSWIKRLGQIIERDGHILAHQVQLGLLIRYALEYAALDSDNVGDPADTLIRLLLAVNELHVDAARMPSTPTSPSDFLGLELQSAALPNERLSFVLNRTYQFMKWAEDLDKADKDYLPLRSDFERLLGISFEDYAAAAFGFFAHFLTIKSAKDLIDKPVNLNVTNFAAAIPRPAPFWTWLKLVSRPVGALPKVGLLTFTTKDLAPFISTPLITVDDDIVLCPVPSLLENTLGTGLYFALFDSYKKRDGECRAEQFSRLYGKFLENYVYDLLRTLTPSDGFAVRREQVYRVRGGAEHRSTDITVQNLQSGDSVFVEVTKKRYRLIETLLNMERRAFEADIDQMIVEKAEQIDGCLADLAANEFSLDISPTTVQPVVVGGQPVPGTFAMPAYVQSELAKRHLLRGTAPLIYLSIEDVEALAVSAPGAVDLFALLAEKTNHPNGFAKIQELEELPLLLQARSFQKEVSP